MKDLKFYLLAILTGFLSCTDREKNNSSGIALIPEESIRMVLDSFVKENSQYPIYELYIDKITPEECEFMIYAGKNSLTQRENNRTNQAPLNYATVSGKKIDIFSGVELYFKMNNSTTPKPVTKEIEPSIFWIVQDSLGILSFTYRGTEAPNPFMPLPKYKPTVVFKPPF